MAGVGLQMLFELIVSIQIQMNADYEIIVSDSSGDLAMQKHCEMKGVKYVEGRFGAAANLNNAIDHAQGDIIKPMFQDDRFIERHSLQKIQTAFDEGAQWIACDSQNGGEDGYRSDLFHPYPHSSIEALREGENTYGSPSVMAWRKNDLRFDENLPWLFDCEFYGRMAERYGVPVFVDTPIFIRQWSGMATNVLATGAQRVLDHNYVVEKYR